MKNVIILGIETSCDDTSVAIVKNGKVLSNITLSTIKEHAKYGGIVPEMAARGHEQSLYECTQRAIKAAKVKIHELTAIAYTSEPGLPGSLHIGKVFAKALSSSLNIPLIPINHMMGHVFSAFIDKNIPIKFPLISLVVSGGHTTIYLFTSLTKFKILNQTADDAVGETLDKIGRMLELPYPGGISIDSIYDPNQNQLKLIQHYNPNESFSFSGIKTHILNLINQSKMKHKPTNKILIASSLLKWVVDELMIKLNYYAKQFNINTMVIGGGCSANQLLQDTLTNSEFNVLLPETKYTGDNAAMIAWYSYWVK